MFEAQLVVLMMVYMSRMVVTCRDPNIGSAQETALQMDECLRAAVPTQVYILCCLRENNCSLARYQAKGIDCISRIAAMGNDSMLGFQSSGQSGSSSRSERWLTGEVTRRAIENCRRLPKARQQLCIRNELLKHCQNEVSMSRQIGSARMYNRRGSIPSSGSSIWDSPVLSDSYPVDSYPEWARGVVYRDGYNYPRTYISRRLYGRENGGRGRNYRGGGGGGGGSSSYSYGDMSDEDEEDYGYGSSTDDSYSRYK